MASQLTVVEVYNQMKHLVEEGLGDLPLVSLDNGDLSSFNEVDTVAIGYQIDQDYIVEESDYFSQTDNDPELFDDNEVIRVVYIS